MIIQVLGGTRGLDISATAVLTPDYRSLPLCRREPLAAECRLMPSRGRDESTRDHEEAAWSRSLPRTS